MDISHHFPDTFQSLPIIRRRGSCNDICNQIRRPDVDFRIVSLHDDDGQPIPLTRHAENKRFWIRSKNNRREYYVLFRALKISCACSVTPAPTAAACF